MANPARLSKGEILERMNSPSSNGQVRLTPITQSHEGSTYAQSL